MLKSAAWPARSVASLAPWELQSAASAPPREQPSADQPAQRVPLSALSEAPSPKQ
jgi:hypothetical protein